MSNVDTLCVQLIMSESHENHAGKKKKKKCRETYDMHMTIPADIELKEQLVYYMVCYHLIDWSKCKEHENI